MKKIILGLILSLLLITPFQNTVFADEKGSITINYIIEEDDNGNRTSIPVAGATFKVYKVYSSNYTTITLQPPFDAIEFGPLAISGDDIKNMESEDIQKLSEEFETFVDASTPLVATCITDSSGKFTLDELDMGAYLFIQEKPIIIDYQYFMANSFLVTVPNEDKDENLIFNIDIKPKGTIVKSPEITKYVNDVTLYALLTKEEIFTYSICTFIPTVAVNKLTIYDVLEDVLEFAPKINANVVIGEGADIVEINDPIGLGYMTINKESRTMTLELEHEFMAGLKGKPITISFDAKIKKDANLSKYKDKRVPNHACYAVDKFISQKRNGNYLATRYLNSPLMFVGPLRLGDYVFEMCSEDVYVYAPEKPFIPNTAVLVMETLEENPWIILVVMVLVALIVKRISSDYNKETR